tara:strand:- start:70 stop:237 length:168 start_codon:yes stop_codon:yes gene_type:complete
LAWAETDLKHTWTPVYNEDKKYWENMPAVAADSAYVFKPFENTSPEDSEVTRTPN